MSASRVASRRLRPRDGRAAAGARIHPRPIAPHVERMARGLASRYTAARTTCLGFALSRRRHGPL
jgi:hypothetical protein